MSAVLWAVLGYVALQLAFAFWVSRRVRNETDYLLAGRQLGPWLATFTVFATWFGAETCIGAAGQAYAGGLGETKADPFGYALGIVAFGLFVAAALWRSGIVTLADLFRRRYGAGVERLTAIIMIPTSLLWAAAQVRAFGQVLAASSELGVFVAITLAALVVVAYTAVGGLWADAMSDLLQGAVLMLGIAVLGYVLFVEHEGLRLLSEQPADRLSLHGIEESSLGIVEALAVPIVGSLVAQELASRTLAARSPQLARRATVTAGVLYLAIGLVPVSLGLVAAGIIGPLDEPEQVVMAFAQRELPQILYIIFVGALVSAILSTVDSALLVAGSLTAHNLILPLRPQLDERGRLRANRLAVLAFGVVAYVLALVGQSVYDLVIQASSLGTAGLFVLLVFSLWLPGIGGARSAYAALIAGLAVYVAGAYLFEFSYPYLSSIAAALLAYLAYARSGDPAAQPATA